MAVKERIDGVWDDPDQRLLTWKRSGPVFMGLEIAATDKRALLPLQVYLLRVDYTEFGDPGSVICRLVELSNRHLLLNALLFNVAAIFIPVFSNMRNKLFQKATVTI